MKFRRIPALVDAEQFDGTFAGAKRLQALAGIDHVRIVVHDKEATQIEGQIAFRGQYVKIEPGDWLVRFPEGATIWTTDANFRATFAPAEDAL